MVLEFRDEVLQREVLLNEQVLNENLPLTCTAGSVALLCVKVKTS